ncbi:TIM barrel protein [Ructibacterium gallinarum]|uniref:TIM barrel protein n=1 Tax=Ructibacterium gallinarum TaxID=2779355 RepID=A0A9D5RAP8_9FIRM|nr:TIM barrel protein [Ructibacterium gallinarum]MBE5039298.1 TIM barrel protein [Ructibacterium gallinarum]
MEKLEDRPLFGPAGNAESFFAAGHKSSLEAPEWLKQHHLDCYEYQCGHGVRISEDAAAVLGERARENGIALSVHAPYYISLSSTEEEKRLRSVDYIIATLKAAAAMGADRIVVHSGSCAKITRREALKLAADTLQRALIAAEQAGLGHIYICPETMGKVQQLGNTEEVVKLCMMSDRLIPAIDFGHVNAQTCGGLKEKADFAAILDLLERKLNPYQAQCFHIHYSRIEYTNAGEKKHHTFAETEYEPEFEPLAELIAERGLTPRVICESAGTQTEDAVEMKKIYLGKRAMK